VPVGLLLAVALLCFGLLVLLGGVYMVGGLGWALVVAGATIVGFALVVLPT
jgi:hypothetical protein